MSPVADYYESRGRVLTAVGDLRDFARLRNLRERQWYRLFEPGEDCSRIETILAYLALTNIKAPKYPRYYPLRVKRLLSKTNRDRVRIQSRRPACG